MPAKRCTIYANCQAGGIAHFLKKARFPYEIDVFHNYQLILGEQSPEAMRESVSRCDLFIYQPTDGMKHGDLSSDHQLTEIVPKSAQTLSFAYQYNDGFFPLIEHGFVRGAEHLNPEYWTMDREELKRLYDRCEVDFAFLKRFTACLTEQALREEECDVKTADFIWKHTHLELFLNFNHPASALLAELARQVFRLVTGEEPVIPIEHENEANLPCCMPVSRYVIAHYGWKREPHESAHEFYRDMLLRAYDDKARPDL